MLIEFPLNIREVCLYESSLLIFEIDLFIFELFQNVIRQHPLPVLLKILTTLVVRIIATKILCDVLIGSTSISVELLFRTLINKLSVLGRRSRLFWSPCSYLSSWQPALRSLTL